MIKELTLLSSIGIISYIYNCIIYPYIVLLIDYRLYNIIIPYMIIIIQLDNFTLLKDLQKKKEEDREQEKMDERYLKIISNQLLYICKKQDEIIKNIIIEEKKNKHKMLVNKINRSYNDLNDA